MITLTVGCEDRAEVIGRDLIPDSLKAYYDTSEVIHAFTRESDSVVTNLKSQFLFGQNIHPLFGETTSRLVSEINLIDYESYSFGDNPEADSVILEIDFTDYTGDPFPQMDYYLYEFEEEIRIDTSIYSNSDIEGQYNPLLLGTGKIIMVDSVIKFDITEQSIIDKFFNAPDTVYKNNDNLQNYIRGLYFVPERITGNGAIMNLNFNDQPALLTIHYSNDDEDSLSYSLEIGGTSKKFNLYDRYFEGYPVDEYLNNGDDPDSLVYLGTPVGVNGIIRFPWLSAWLDSMPVAINHAQLIITPADTSVTGLSSANYPSSLNLYRLDENGVKQFVYDYLLNSTGFGGTYDNETNSYRFNLKVHIQSYLNGDLENVDLVLQPTSMGETYTQLIIYGGTSANSGKMRLEIVYTVL